MKVNEESSSPATRVGLIRMRDHCTFTWRQHEGSDLRSVEVRATHCSECVAALETSGFRLVRERVDG
jgi:hypothetical protein